MTWNKRSVGGNMSWMYGLVEERTREKGTVLVLAEIYTNEINKAWGYARISSLPKSDRKLVMKDIGGQLQHFRVWKQKDFGMNHYPRLAAALSMARMSRRKK